MNRVLFIFYIFIVLLLQESISQSITPASSDALRYGNFAGEICENKADWCDAVNPDCSLEFVQDQCRKHCKSCKPDCIFVAVHPDECPANTELPKCTLDMALDELCEADQPLLGNPNYHVDNCNGKDVFRCTRGCLNKLPFIMTNDPNCKKLKRTCEKLSKKCNMVLGSQQVLGKSKVAKKCNKALRGDANVTVNTFCTVTCATCTDGMWSTWSSDGECYQKRSRVCNNPSPTRGGIFCPGSSTETAMCCNSGSCQTSTTPPTEEDYFPTGPQQGVNFRTVTNGGWELCFSQAYNSSMGPSQISQIMNSQCTKANLMMGCRVTNSNTIRLLAWAPRSCVFTTSTGSSGSATTTCQGTEWYFNNNYSWGFAKEGDSVQKSTCDYLTTGCNECRLCWHTKYYKGYRCGSTTYPGGEYERLIFQID